MSALAGILEGYTTAQQLKRQRDQDMADRAIAQANMQFKREGLALDREKAAGLATDRNADNLRQLMSVVPTLLASGYTGEQVTPYIQNIGRAMGIKDADLAAISLPKSPKLAQAEADRVARLEQMKANADRIAEGKDKNLYTRLLSQAAANGMDEYAQHDFASKGLEMARAVTTGGLPKTMDRIAEGGGSLLPANAQDFLTGKQTPKFQMMQSRAAAQNAQAAATTANAIERTRQLKDLYPIVKANKQVQGDLNAMNLKLRKEQVQTQKLINQFTPEQLQMKIDQAAAMIGKTQADTARQLEQLKILRENAANAAKSGAYVTPSGVMKLSPADPRASSGTLNQTRRMIGTVENSYRATLKTLTEQQMMLDGMPAKIAAAEQGIYPEGVKPPEDAAQAQAFQQNYIAKLKEQAGRVQQYVNQLTPLAEGQKKALDDLEKERRRAAGEKNGAENLKLTNPPKPGGSVAQGRAGVPYGVYAPTKVRKLSNGVEMPVNPPEPPARKPGTRPNYWGTPEGTAKLKARQQELARTERKAPPAKPLAKMTDKELDAAIEAAKRKRK